MENGNLAMVGILTYGLGLASLFAYLCFRFNLPTILGYLLAGYFIGPYSPGFVADVNVAEQLAEIGVILMLFGVGMHFKLEDLIRVKHIAIPGAILQTAGTALITVLVVTMLGWDLYAGLFIGLSISVASTVILIRILTEYNFIRTIQGHIAVGWTVVEDILTVMMLVLVPTVAQYHGGEELSTISIATTILMIVVKFIIMIALMMTWGHKIVDYILVNIIKVPSGEVFTLTVLALVFVIAVGTTYLFGTSIALGAFIAGMLIGRSSLRLEAAANSLPLKDIFAIFFFLSVGMLFNPMAIIDHFWLFVGVLSIILFVKFLIAFGLMLAFGYSRTAALTIALALSQIGEFSFILSEQAMNAKLMPDEGFDIIVACSFVAITVNALLFRWFDIKPSPEDQFTVQPKQ